MPDGNKSAVVNLRYEIDNSAALTALRDIASAHSKLASQLAKPISVAAPAGSQQVSSHGVPLPASSPAASPSNPSGPNWMTAQMNQGVNPFAGVSSSQRSVTSSAPTPVANFQNSLFRQMLVQLQGINAKMDRPRSPSSLIGQKEWAGFTDAQKRSVLFDQRIDRHAEARMDNADLASRMRGRGGGGDRHGDGAGDGAHPSGFANALTRQLTRMAVAGMVYHVISNLPHAISSGVATSQRTDLSQGQRAMGIVNEIPIVGSLFNSMRRLVQAFDGTTESIRLINERFRYVAIHSQTTSQLMSTGGSMATDRGVASANLFAFQNMVGTPTPNLNQATYAGQVEQREESSRHAAIRAIRMAEARAEGAGGGVEAAEAGVTQVDRRLADLRRRRDSILSVGTALGLPTGPGAGFVGGGNGMVGPQQNSGGGTNGSFNSNLAAGVRQMALMVSYSNALNSINDQIARTEQERIARLNRVTQELQRQGAAQADIDRAHINALQNERNILQSRERDMAGGARRLGGMNPIDREIGMQSLRGLREIMEREGTIENAPQYMIQQAQSVAGNTVGAWMERSGEGSANFRELRDQFNEFGRGAQGTSLEQIRTSMNALTDAINDREVVAARNSAMRHIDSIDRTLTSILQSISGGGQAQQGAAFGQQLINNANANQ